ncbi:MAG: AAA family ATPase [Candidatus Micrarchaeota archaeon]
MLVFALGIKAVGKSRVIAELNRLGAGIREVSYGDVMLEIAKKEAGLGDREEIAKLPAAKQNAIRDAAAKAIRETADKERLVFLNTHGFIYTIPHHTYLPGSPDAVSDILRPDMLLLVEASPEAIIERRERDLAAGRRREVGSVEEVSTALFSERVAAIHLATRFGAQLKFFDNTLPVERNSDAVASLAQLFKTLDR